MSGSSADSFFDRYEKLLHEIEELREKPSTLEERALVERAIEKSMSEMQEFVEIRSKHERKYLAERPLMVSFLANLLSNKTKRSIKAQIEANPGDFFVIQHLFFGMWLRNQLRRAGFEYDAITLDNIWSGLLLDALYLPKDHIKLPPNLRRKLWKIKSLNSIRRSPGKWRMLAFAGLIASAIFLEVLHNSFAVVFSLLVILILASWIWSYLECTQVSR